VHLIDQVHHLFGMPKKVTGFVRWQRKGERKGPHDGFTALLKYDGCEVTVKASVMSAEEEQLRFWVRGSKGSFKKVRLII
jgi:predicted dehydrogenase